VLVKRHPAFVYRGDLGALPDYKVATGGWPVRGAPDACRRRVHDGCQKL